MKTTRDYDSLHYPVTIFNGRTTTMDPRVRPQNVRHLHAKLTKIRGNRHTYIYTDRQTAHSLKLLNLCIDTLTLGAVWQYLLPGGDTHPPLSTFFRLLAPVGSDLPIGEVLKNQQRQLFRLIYYNLFLTEKGNNS